MCYALRCHLEIHFKSVLHVDNAFVNAPSASSETPELPNPEPCSDECDAADNEAEDI